MKAYMYVVLAVFFGMIMFVGGCFTLGAVGFAAGIMKKGQEKQLEEIEVSGIKTIDDILGKPVKVLERKFGTPEKQGKLDAYWTNVPGFLPNMNILVLLDPKTTKVNSAFILLPNTSVRKAVTKFNSLLHKETELSYLLESSGNIVYVAAWEEKKWEAATSSGEIEDKKGAVLAISKRGKSTIFKTVKTYSRPVTEIDGFEAFGVNGFLYQVEKLSMPTKFYFKDDLPKTEDLKIGESQTITGHAKVDRSTVEVDVLVTNVEKRSKRAKLEVKLIDYLGKAHSPKKTTRLRLRSKAEKHVKFEFTDLGNVTDHPWHIQFGRRAATHKYLFANGK